MNAALFQEAVESIVERIFEGVHTSIPASVESFSDGMISARPAISRVMVGGEEIELPIISEIPVLYPRTANFAITFPLEVGDFVLLVFSERAIESFVEHGEASPQADGRRFSLTDAVAIPGMYGKKGGKIPTDWTASTILFNEASITIADGGDIEIKSPGKISIAGTVEAGAGTMKKALATEDFVNTVFANHIHPTTTPGSPTAIPTPIPLPSALTKNFKAD